MPHIIGPQAASIVPMRLAGALLILTCSASAQFKSTVPLVVAPTTVTDSKGHNVDGLTADDLILYDNNVPQKIQMDWMSYPIDLVVAVQTSANSGAVIDKLGGSGILFAQLLAADAGETAVISFSDEVNVHQEFTSNPDFVIHSLRMLRMEGDNAHILDAMHQALSMLEQRPPGRRRIILMIAERRDRSSKTALSEVMEQVQRQNAAVYWLTYSPFLEPFTVKNKTAEDLKPEAERIQVQKCALCPAPDDTPVPFNPGPGGNIYAIKELVRLHKPDLSGLFTKTTGGRELSFLKKSALEQAIQLVSEEVHRQYILSFEPRGAVPSEPGTFHTIRVVVKNRPELHVKTREGYWIVQ
jgi:VWFA-related protein